MRVTSHPVSRDTGGMVHGLDRERPAVSPPPLRALPGPLPGRQAAALGRHLPDQAARAGRAAGHRARPPPGAPSPHRPRPGEGTDAVRGVRDHHVVAGVEGPAPRLGLRHPQEGREAHPAGRRRPPAWRAGRQHDRGVEGGDGRRGPRPTDGQHLPVPPWDDPERRRRRRLPGPLTAGTQERRRPRRGHPQPARAAPGGVADSRAARPAHRGDRCPLPGAGAGRGVDRDALGRAGRAALG